MFLFSFKGLYLLLGFGGGGVGYICRMDWACSGAILIPLLVTRKPRNFSDSTSKVHLSGFKCKWCNPLVERLLVGELDDPYETLISLAYPLYILPLFYTAKS